MTKPWGRVGLPPPFHNPTSERIGEIWFEAPAKADLPFLTKYIFTSERLSVQVHPNDAQAQRRGEPRGKTECWYVLDAEPGAEIGLGLNRQVDSQDLRSAAIDGSIMAMLNWLSVKPGDFFHVPAGTIHAIGAGVSLLEFQQNSDVTYRLYDYGRPRELHLDEALGVASLAKLAPNGAIPDSSPTNILHSGDDFSFIRARNADDVPEALAGRTRWVMPIRGSVAAGGDHGRAGDCLLIEACESIQIGRDSEVLIGAGGGL